MKITLLAPSLEAGGAERQLVFVANGLAQRGHAVSIALFRAQGPLLDEVSPLVTVHSLDKAGRWDIAGFLRRAYRYFRQSRPDVLYSFLGVPNLTACLMKVMLPGLAIVWSVRASNMDLSRYTWLSRACWKAECLLSRFADMVICNSEAGKKFAVSQGFPADKVRVVLNGIDTEVFRRKEDARKALRAEWRVAEDDVVIGTVARLDVMKGHGLLIEAAGTVREMVPKARFVCVGDGPLRAELELEATEAGVDFMWLGGRDDMQDIYSAFDMCCLPSLFGEGFPNVVGEAMSCGVPCVATDVGDVASIVGETGIVVPAGSSSELARGIISMAGRIDDVGTAVTRVRIKERFSLAQLFASTEKALSEVLD